MATAPSPGGDRATAGLCDAAQWLPEGMPGYWRVYFQAPDMDAAVQTIEAHGGRVVDGPQDSPFGREATVVDPAGATFQLNQPGDGWGEGAQDWGLPSADRSAGSVRRGRQRVY